MNEQDGPRIRDNGPANPRHTTENDAPVESDPPVEWERFACYCTGERHYYVREPYGICPPARVTWVEATRRD